MRKLTAVIGLFAALSGANPATASPRGLMSILGVNFGMPQSEIEATLEERGFACTEVPAGAALTCRSPSPREQNARFYGGRSGIYVGARFMEFGCDALNICGMGPNVIADRFGERKNAGVVRSNPVMGQYELLGEGGQRLSIERDTVRLYRNKLETASDTQ